MTFSRTLTRRTLVAGLAAASLFTSALSWANGTGWTTKPVQITVGFAPGGGVDILARLFTAELQKKGMTVVVENRAGAGSSMAAAYVAGRPADGTALMMVNDSFSLAPAIYSRLSYDPRKDLAPVVGVAYASMVVVVPGNSRLKTMNDLVAASKSPLNWGSCGSGTAPHLAGEMMNMAFKTNNTHVPYKGCGPALVDVLGGQLDYAIVTVSGAVPYIGNGRMRALAITAAQRSPILPDVPTVAESGAPGFNMSQYQGLAVPGSTPEPVKQQIYQAVAEIAQSKEIQKRLLELGYTPAAENPAEFTKVVHSDIDKFRALAKQLNLKAD
ncbi:tripartite tricarboxylate transporter substrate binding protein [Ramlibacter sp. AW1]|uniref:Tripartite tricarboxylate transporter substrate binding protein n=1 Tax=Ramlibacter aurantiacus TaxID=2801330 RepID=A0A936ZIF4_9BURK|nr:tripartite tricarboxylate transporter substrate-binding protein [Ramlibacter aurantiacus]MBL0421497.1 tripartite tricarboxylate transporter substrate binding protein [Ramlibacter aurantiacus]